MSAKRVWETERFICDECGETWVWGGESECPFCNGERIQPIDETDDDTNRSASA